MSDRQMELGFGKAQAVRDAAIGKVETGAGDAWMQAAEKAILLTARRLGQFTSDDVWATGLSRPPNDSRAMGAAMRNVQRTGRIVPTDRFITSSRSVNHCRPQRVWRYTE